MTDCLQTTNVYLDDVLITCLINCLSLSNLGMSPLEATVLYIEQSGANERGGIERYDSWLSFKVIIFY